MEIYSIGSVLAGVTIPALLVFLGWRYFWFFRNPDRTPPPGSAIVSPADGTVVYVKQLEKKRGCGAGKKRAGCTYQRPYS